VTEGELADGVTDRVRTALDCARLLPLEAALPVVDAALRDQVSRTELLLGCARLPRSGRSRALRVVELASADAANPFESVLRAVLVDVPGAAFVPQQWVPGIGRPDLLDRVNGVVVRRTPSCSTPARPRWRTTWSATTASWGRASPVLRFAWKHAMFVQDYV